MTASVRGGAPTHSPTVAGPVVRSAGVILREADLTEETYPTYVVAGTIRLPAGSLVHSVFASCISAFESSSASVKAPVEWDEGTDMLGNQSGSGSELGDSFDAAGGGAGSSGSLKTAGLFYAQPVTFYPSVTLADIPADRAARTGVALVVVSYSVPEYDQFDDAYAD